MDAHQILNSIADPIFVKDRQHRWVMLNDAYCRFMGYRREELIGKSDYDFFPKEQADVFWQKDEVVFTTGQENANEERFTDSKGVVHTISTKKTLYRDAAGPVYIVGIIRDVTLSKTSERQLAEARSFLDSIVENIPNMIFVKEAKELRFVRFNRAGEELLGYSRGELVGKNDYDFFPKYEADFFTTKDREVLKHRRTVEIPEETVKTRHQGERLLRTVKVPICDAYGNPTHLLGISEDITERRRAVEALRESQSRLSVILENTLAVIYMKDLEGRYLMVNRRFVDIFNLPCESIIGKTDHEIFDAQLADTYRRNDLVVLRSGQPIEFEEHAQHDGGLLRSYISVKVPLKDSSGKVYAMCGISTDITELKRAEEALRQKEAVDNKSRFLSMVSHELRTPLQSMREGISVVLEGLLGPMNEEQKESLSIAQRNVDRLTRLINDVLDMQRLDVHPLPLEREPYDLNALVRETVKTMQPVARKKGVQLEAALATGLPGVSFEKDRMTQVLLNLINNAVKFTEKGKVSVSTRRSDAGLVVSVLDTGIGIAEADLGRIFESFGPVRPSAPDGSRNSGLGLAISRKIVDRLGGRIEVRSKPGEGSEFTVVLPLPAAR